MKILIVANLFPPDYGVSTFRMKFFYDKMTSDGHSVDVLKLGPNTNFDGRIKTIDEALFRVFFKSVLYRRRIATLVRPLLVQYDLVLASAIPFGLYEIAFTAGKLGIPYILDQRDLPDLTSSEQKSCKPRMWLSLKAWIINKYIDCIARNAVALLCVGDIATALVQKRHINSPLRVLNVHNGYNLEDRDLVRGSYVHRRPDNGSIVIGCVGNIFKFRDTPDLRRALYSLGARYDNLTLLHWGRASDSLLAYIQTETNIRYVRCPAVPRTELLKELHNVDCFLLPCAEDLIWEPTTSVFDYILYDKTVVFTGLRNNEAFSILQRVGADVVTADMIPKMSIIEAEGNGNYHDIINSYSRDAYYDRLSRVLSSL
jgi:glycosyltransferase involved in cell wall biosynthesis